MDRYEEALARAKQAIKDCGDNEGRKKMIFGIFPVLAESEDERIRKHIIEILNRLSPCHWDGNEKSKCLAYLEKHKEQPAERSGEQNAAIEIVCDVLLNDYGPGEKLPCCTGGYWDVSRDYLIARLKSLRPQPKQKWSEEDERNIETIVDIVHRSYAPFDTIRDDYPINCEALLSWLKSLRPQPHWKPSEEQMEALEMASRKWFGEDSVRNLSALYEDLKKL